MPGEKILIEQQYFGHIAYWSLLLSTQDVLLEAHEHYQKRSFRNKTELLSAQGRHMLTIPLVKGKHQQQPIQEVKIANQEPWQAVHIKTLQTCYRSAPFYDHYQEEIKRLILNEESHLWAYCLPITTWVSRQLNTNLNLMISDKFEVSPMKGIKDKRNFFKPGQSVATFIPMPYAQVFENRLGFIENLSILDLLFCYGPGTANIINQSVWSV